MKTYETKTVEHEKRELTSHTCDKCGESLFENIFEVSEVEIVSRLGQRYPEGTRYVEREFDCCVGCFDKHVVPALKALGFCVREEEVDY